MSSIKEVAHMAGVSTATVSRVLANKPHVKQAIRERVLTVVEELNYRPNRVARSLRARQSNIIGLIISDIQNPFFHAVSRAVEDTAYEKGYSVILCNADEDPEKEARYIDLMHDENVAGVILSPTRKSSDNFREAMQNGMSMVVIDRKVKDFDIDTVLIDNIESAAKLVTHLAEHGRKRIAGLFGLGSTTGRERYEGFVKGLEKHGMVPDPAITKYVNARVEDGYSAMLEMLDLDNPPDAVFTTNGLLAAGALGAIRERGKTIPDEIAFGSFDKTAWTKIVEPPITVIEQPTYEIGKLATELMIKRLEDPSRPTREVTLKTKLVLRKSCGCQG